MGAVNMSKKVNKENCKPLKQCRNLFTLRQPNILLVIRVETNLSISSNKALKPVIDQPSLHATHPPTTRCSTRSTAEAQARMATHPLHTCPRGPTARATTPHQVATRRNPRGAHRQSNPKIHIGKQGDKQAEGRPVRGAGAEELTYQVCEPAAKHAGQSIFIHILIRN